MPAPANRTRCSWHVASPRMLLTTALLRCGSQDCSVARFSRINGECVHTLRLPSLCIIAQGAKRVIVGEEVYDYDASRMIVFSVALPVAAQVTQASRPEPYLSLKLDLEPRKIAELVLKVFPNGVPPVQERKAVYVAPLDLSVLNAATRLMQCLAQPGDVELLAPLVVDEILIRLLRSPIGLRVAQMGFAESSVHRVEKAISWLRANFSQPMKVEELAEIVNMSVSSFHEHFKSVDFDEPVALSKGAATPRGEASHVVGDDGCGHCRAARWLLERIAVQQGIQPLLRECADQGHRTIAQRFSSLGLTSRLANCRLVQLLRNADTDKPRRCGSHSSRRRPSSSARFAC